MDLFHHERLHRSDATMARILELAVTVCGAGALGANVLEGLARTGFGRLRVIDRDRVEEHNLSTQPYQRSDVGSHKARILAHALYRAVGVEVEARAEELTATNARKLLRDSQVVVDTFDNSASRGAVKAWCEGEGMACLHVGLAAGFAEVLWNEVYTLPSPAGDDVCDYPLARSLATLASSVAVEVLARYAERGVRESYTITLEDFAIRPFAG